MKTIKKNFMKKNILIYGFFIAFASLFASCDKDLQQTVLIPPASLNAFTSSASTLVLTDANKNSEVVTFEFQPSTFNINVQRATYTLQFDVPADTSGDNAWKKAIELRFDNNVFRKTYKGEDFNSLLVNQLKLPTGTESKIVARLKMDLNQSNGTASVVPPLYSKVEMMVTPYEMVIIYPALIVRGGGSWVTPAARTNGYVLTSAGFNNKYEGYLYLPNADGWNGDGFKLESTVDGKWYGYGADANNILEGANGNLWLTPAPNYVKVNVDLSTNTINWTPVQFFLSGSHNNWDDNAATPMTYNPTTKKLEADNVALTAGGEFAFIANKKWDINYKVNALGDIVFAGAPDWGAAAQAINIKVPQTGVFKVTLDLSQGDGKYTYSIE